MGERTKKRLVVKVGTNTLTGGEDRLARPAMLGVARQIARLVHDGHQVALVSSGAIVAGRQALRSRNGKAASRRRGEGYPVQAGAGRGRADQADADVGRAVFEGRSDRRADAADARRSGRPPGISERAQHAARAARAPGRSDHQRERRRRDRGNQDRRQRQPVGAGGEPDRRRPADPAHRSGRACTRPIRGATRRRR